MSKHDSVPFKCLLLLLWRRSRGFCFLCLYNNCISCLSRNNLKCLEHSPICISMLLAFPALERSKVFLLQAVDEDRALLIECEGTCLPCRTTPKSIGTALRACHGGLRPHRDLRLVCLSVEIQKSLQPHVKMRRKGA